MAIIKISLLSAPLHYVISHFESVGAVGRSQFAIQIKIYMTRLDDEAAGNVDEKIGSAN